jgi:hypothetical protein
MASASSYQPENETGDGMIAQPSHTDSPNGKTSHNAPVLSEFDHRLRVLELTVQLLIARTSMGDYWSVGLQEARRILAAVPLPTAEFASASQHLKNAVKYCQEEEFGAATFELRALRGQLHRL